MSGRILTGMILIVLGLGFFLQQADIWSFSDVLSSGWPIILVIIGIIQLFSRNRTSILPGLLFIFAGALFLANTFLDINLFIYFWPIVLVVAGISFLFTHEKRRVTPISGEATNTSAIFGGQNIHSTSQNYEGGQVTALFGGVELDLRDVKISEQGAVLELNAVFGGIKIEVPQNIRVEVKGTPIFGGFDNKTRRQAADLYDAPVLKINYAAIFGGVELKD